MPSSIQQFSRRTLASLTQGDLGGNPSLDPRRPPSSSTPLSAARGYDRAKPAMHTAVGQALGQGGGCSEDSWRRWVRNLRQHRPVSPPEAWWPMRLVGVVAAPPPPWCSCTSAHLA
jgi:hypothetical protein